MTKTTKTNHYTYKITHQNGKYYVGRHSSKKDPTKDTYMRSGKWVKSIKDRSTLTKIIIAYYPTIEELKLAEQNLIEQCWDNQKYCMNYLYSSGGFSSGENHFMYGRFGDKHHNFGKCGELSPTYGSTRSEKSKQLMLVNTTRISGDKHHMFGKTGVLCPNYGTTRSEKSKQLMSKQLMSKQQSGENNPNATITEHIAKLIKIRLLEGVSVKLIAAEYNTTVNVVYNIKYNHTWKHVTI